MLLEEWSLFSVFEVVCFYEKLIEGFAKKQAPYGTCLRRLLTTTVVIAATEARDKKNPDQPFAAVAVVATASAVVAA